MDKLVKLTKDVWTFGCKGDVLRLGAERLKALEAEAEKLGAKVYEDVKEEVTAATRAAAAAEAEVVADAPKVAEAAKAVEEKVAETVADVKAAVKGKK